MGEHELRTRVIPYLRGELSPVEAVEFEDALRSNPDLRQELDEVRETFHALSRAMPDTEPAESLKDVFRTRLAAEPQESIPRPSIPDLERELGPKARRRRFVWVLAAAASLMIAVAVWLRGDTTPEVPEAPERASLMRSQGDVIVTDLHRPGVPGWRITRRAPADAVTGADGSERDSEGGTPPPVIRLGQRVQTGENSLAVLQLTDRSTVWLDESTAIALISTGAYLDTGQSVRVESGRASFAVTSRRVPGSGRASGANHNGVGDNAARDNASGDGAPTGESRDRVEPFVVLTPHGQIRVRGTRFLVEVDDEMTLVVVLEGRVDVQNSHDRVADIRRIDPGWFAAIGTPAALAARLPEDPLPDARDADDPRGQDPFHGLPAGAERITPDEREAGVGSYTVPPTPSPEGTVVIARPLVRVTLRLSHLQVFASGDNPGGDPEGTVAVHNVSPLILQVDHPANRDNVKIKYLAPDASSAGWAPVTTMRAALQPGDRKRYEVPLQRVLYRERYGTYYLGAVYEGPLGLIGRTHPDLRDQAGWTQVSDIRSVSRRHSVLYREAARDDGDSNGTGNGNDNPNDGDGGDGGPEDDSGDPDNGTGDPDDGN